MERAGQVEPPNLDDEEEAACLTAQSATQESENPHLQLAHHSLRKLLLVV